MTTSSPQGVTSKPSTVTGGSPAISLKDWNEASTEQRGAWLAAGVLVREEDREALDRQAFSWKR